MIWLQKTKWTSAKSQFFQGQKYDSKFEADYAQELFLRKKAKDIKDFEAHKKIELIVNNTIVCDYYIDFVVNHNDGMIEYIECKGFQFPIWKLKWKLFCALFENNPDIKITLVQQGKFKSPKIRRIKTI